MGRILRVVPTNGAVSRALPDIRGNCPSTRFCYTCANVSSPGVVVNYADGPTHRNNSESDSDETLDPSVSGSSSPPATPKTPVPASESDSRQKLFTSIGRYRLLKKLGEGGMGQVWLTEQTAPLRRQVALKLIRAGMYDQALLQRFQSERQSLAIMEHPTIAKVFDAGATNDGQPYFVMEYVRGLSITGYCDEHRLGIRNRLELFIKVCEGVQHAHQKAIIHRDLKPSNILITEVDGKPMPRIIDFGLAKAASPEAVAQTALTQLGGFVGTPAYMSPEQANHGLQDVDTRTDVYSLGVVLYELLTGSLPFDPKRWQNQPLHEVLRQIQEEEPPRASAKVSSDSEGSLGTARARQTDPRQLVKALRGDLDWIVAKALEKDRALRYGTPSELSADIVRYLQHEPVMARRSSMGYRLRRYVQRHHVFAGVAAASILLVSGFVVLQTIQLHQTRTERDRANSERDRANRERDRATRITDFMTNMFKVSDPTEARGNTITAREVLDKASQDIDTGLGNDPELQAQMMYVMATTYDNLGLYAKAESLLRRVVEIRQRVLGAANSQTLEAEYLLGGVLWQLDRMAESEKLLRQALTESRSVLGPSRATTIRLEKQLAVTLSERKQYEEAEKLEREALDNSRRALGPENQETMANVFVLSAILGDEGKYAESEKLNREALDFCRSTIGPDDPQTLGMIAALADTLSDEGHYKEAEEQAQQALDISLRVNGPHHPSTAGYTYNLACLAALQGQPDRALSLLRLSLARGLRKQTALEMDSDSDFKSLHGNPQFEKIVADAKQGVQRDLPR
jgi:eukaryotic-like serine/threonine-protein kinase